MNQTAEAAAERPAAEPAPQPRPHPPVGVPADPRQKSPFLAGLLSMLPGLGQVYVGYYPRGFTHALVVAGLITLLASGDLDELTPLVSVFLAFFWLYSVIDAARRAALYNQALVGYGEVEVAQDFRMPTFRGSLLGGLLIAGAGLVLLLHTRFGISMDWVEEWWPVALIAFGGYLVFKAWEERRQASGPGEAE